MSRLHPAAALVLGCLVPSARGRGLELAPDAPRRLEAALSAAIESGRGRDAHRDVLAMLGLLMSRPDAERAVESLRGILAALAPGIARGIERCERRTEARLAMPRKSVATHDAPVPLGTLKPKDLRPRRSRFLR